MKLKELLNITNINNQVRIYFENKDHDDLVCIFVGTSENAIKYFNGCDNFEVQFINIDTDNETKAPKMNIVIR